MVSCPRCGALAGAPCVTAAGRPARREHADRHRQAGVADVTVERAVLDELARIGERDPHLAGGALARVALELARDLDRHAVDDSVAQRALAAGKLAGVLEQLRQLAPPPATSDRLDDLARRRNRRRRAS